MNTDSPKSTIEVNELLMNLFAYFFNEDDKLVRPDGLPYEFSEDNYDAIGELTALYIQACMRERYGLIERFLPDDSELKTNIFLSPTWESSSNPGLIIIQGKGQVRPGMWSRKVCINYDLRTGSCLPYIAKALEMGLSVIVFNPNLNSVQNRPILHHSTMIEHCKSVWQQFVTRPPRNLLILAHSCGGICTISLLAEFKAFFMKRVKGIAFTDSVHKDLTKLSREQREWLARNCVNWKTSSKKPNQFLSAGRASRNGCENRSAGHLEHEWTSHSAYSSVWEYFSQLKGL